MPLLENIDVFTATMLLLTLLSLLQRPLRVLRRLKREIKECARRTIGRAYGLTTYILLFTLWEREQGIVTETG